MGHFASSCFCFVLLLSLAAAMTVIARTADATTTTTATRVQCTAGSQCDRKHHCVKESPSYNFGYCTPFLRSGNECKQSHYTSSKPVGMVNDRQCAPGLICLAMGRRDNPYKMECTTLT